MSVAPPRLDEVAEARSEVVAADDDCVPHVEVQLEKDDLGQVNHHKAATNSHVLHDEVPVAWICRCWPTTASKRALDDRSLRCRSGPTTYRVPCRETTVLCIATTILQ